MTVDLNNTQMSILKSSGLNLRIRETPLRLRQGGLNKVIMKKNVPTGAAADSVNPH